MAKYKLLVGKHVGVDESTGKERLWVAGEVIDTKLQLDKLNGDGEAFRKFERLHEDAPVTPDVIAQANSAVNLVSQQGFDTSKTDRNKYPANDPFESMTIAELRKHADAEEVPLPATAKSKDEIIKVLRAALQPQ